MDAPDWLPEDSKPIHAKGASHLPEDTAYDVGSVNGLLVHCWVEDQARKPVKDATKSVVHDKGQLRYQFFNPNREKCLLPDSIHCQDADHLTVPHQPAPGGYIDRRKEHAPYAFLASAYEFTVNRYGRPIVRTRLGDTDVAVVNFEANRQTAITGEPYGHDVGDGAETPSASAGRPPPAVRDRPDLKSYINALKDAFLRWDELEQMLRLELDKVLEHIVKRAETDHVVFKLVERAEAEGWLPELLEAASRQRPRIELLRQFAQAARSAREASSGPSLPLTDLPNPEDKPSLKRFIVVVDVGPRVPKANSAAVGPESTWARQYVETAFAAAGIGRSIVEVLGGACAVAFDRLPDAMHFADEVHRVAEVQSADVVASGGTAESVRDLLKACKVRVGIWRDSVRVITTTPSAPVLVTSPTAVFRAVPPRRLIKAGETFLSFDLVEPATAGLRVIDHWEGALGCRGYCQPVGYPPAVKAAVCDGLGDEWKRMATLLEVEVPEEAGARGLWDQLEEAGRLSAVRGALIYVGRTDLVLHLRR